MHELFEKYGVGPLCEIASEAGLRLPFAGLGMAGVDSSYIMHHSPKCLHCIQCRSNWMFVLVNSQYARELPNEESRHMQQENIGERM